MTVISLENIFFFDFQYICGVHLRSVYVGIFIHARQNRNCVQQKDTRKRHRRGDVSILCNYYVSPPATIPTSVKSSDFRELYLRSFSN